MPAYFSFTGHVPLIDEEKMIWIWISCPLMIDDEALLAAAKAEHKKHVGPNGYRCPIPAGVKPRVMNDFSKKK